MFALSLLTAAVGVLLAFSVGLNAMKIGVAFRLLDHPDGDRKIHARVTPLVGGFAVVGAAVVAAGPGTSAAPLAGFSLVVCSSHC